MKRTLSLLNILFLAFYAVEAHPQSTADLRSLLDKQVIDSEPYNYSPLSTVKVYAEDYYFYKLNNHQIHNSIKEILGLNDDVIINGDGTSVVIPTDKEVDESHQSLNKFCYDNLNGQTYFSNPNLFYKEEGVSYVFCDIKPILQKYKNETKYIINYNAEFSLVSLWAGWRTVINVGEKEIYFRNENSYIYKRPKFFFNGKYYYILARQTNSEDLSARGYCALKESSEFLPTFGKDSTKTVQNEDVIELNEYGTPVSIKRYNSAEVWNTVVCTHN